MTVMQASGAADGWWGNEWEAQGGRRLGSTLALSLALHVGLLIVAAFVRLPHLGERPLASMEVSLAHLPTPPIRTIEPPKAKPKVAETPKPAPVKSAPSLTPASVPTPARVATPVPVPTPVPAPVPAAVPVPVPVPVKKAAPVPAPPAPAKLRDDLMRDVMKGIQLPPDAPKVGDFAPADRPKKAHLKLPDVPVVPDIQDPAAHPPDVKPRPSFADEMTKEVDEEFKKIKQVELPKTAPLAMPEKPPAPPPMEAKIPSVKAVDTALKVPGMAPGSNAYLGRVRQRISSFWNAPPVDVTGQTYLVIIKFRLHRNGTVSGVVIEQSSGNEYYDLAGKRAVVSAIPLPAFPSELTDPYFDAHFTFTVGDQPQG